MLLRGGGLGLLNLVETGLGQGELLLEVLNDYKARQVVAGSSRSKSLVPDPTPKKPLLVLGCEMSVLEGNSS